MDKSTPLRSLKLSRFGHLWILMSSLAAGGCCVSFYLPYWLIGYWNKTTVTFGTFRACNYPGMVYNRTTAALGTTTIHICARYNDFNDIPSIAWKACTIMQGASCGILLLIALIGLSFMCIKDVLTKKAIRVAAILQLLAGLSFGCSCAFYPLGWDSASVRVICGEQSAIYRLGRCTIGWCYWAGIASSAISLLAAILAFTSFAITANRDRQVNRSKSSDARETSPNHNV
ncbi:uncharacterized protein TRIADDRAFT_52183 [Trichoplax adhaerens]|uniref:Uncharacterized protein n=1 Tax=Trichoplax adhaerens TaxID=10228 RepID=B3RM00_TRIAD|nr:hypothetical protein TRIADDRAFT_52183 [Trichoplax adhaerens]EDV28875.1 hypothetical protein TRIADDRAFT_52183 [Trichoplax adhaerens]|eukprot:XP_002108077.1 hypothetical protein TRIADDRAFT_52183 [Trichoplax adhaerens]